MVLDYLFTNVLFLGILMFGILSIHPKTGVMVHA